jgi:phosphatidylserine decarboxylase
VAGTITRIDYRPGKFLPAYDQGSNDNELNEVWVDHDGQTIVFRQVVGILARRIVCRVREGDQLQRGERIGLMKFGSRMDVFLPSSAQVRARVGEQVVAGETVLATLTTASAG